jgi:hypothetical protein
VLGVGLQNWERYHRLAAHNSFIQVAAETGILGLLCWLGFFYFPMEDSLRAILPGQRFESPPFAAAQLQATLVVWFVTALFLTRNQTLLPYVLAGSVIAANHIQFRPQIRGELEAEPLREDHIKTPDGFVAEEQPEFEVKTPDGFVAEEQLELEVKTQDGFVAEEQPEFEIVSRVLVSWADMRHVSLFVIILLLWWRFMIRGMVPGL